MAAVPSILAALTLSVPFLPQTPALCGGASVAMVFRYWGDRHADVQQFATLVDRRAGGIADHVLVDAVRRRNWRAVPLVGSPELVRARIAAGEPLILLLEDRPGRYHYVVAVGGERDAILVHDPTWGPRRRYTDAELIRRWAPAGYWALLIQPNEGTLASRAAPPAAEPAPEPITPCDHLLNDGLEKIERAGLDAADEILAGVVRECPRSAPAMAELAAVHFSQKRLSDAEALARDAVALDASHAYAWEVLAASRFVRDDASGALDAWNRTGKPRLDSVEIAGLSRTRYALVADVAGLSPNTTLTSAGLRLAGRRLRELPDQTAVDIRYKPDADGFATVHVAIAERPAPTLGPASWATLGARAAIGREARVALPGWSGQGEVWSAGWRWWPGRPRVELELAAPRISPLGGVSRVKVFWERQGYALASSRPVQEQRVHASFTTSNWIAPDLRYELTAGIDEWNGADRTVSVGGTLERRLAEDRVAVMARGVSYAPRFFTGSLTAAVRTRSTDRGFVHVVNGGIDVASASTPVALWPGAGDGEGRPHLLRAHPLIADGVVSGPMLGRTLWHLTSESQRWLSKPALVRVALAAFVDAAAASRGFDHARTAHIDAGLGVRMRVPGLAGTIRADYARGVRDGRSRFSLGLIQGWWGRQGG